MNRSHLIAAVTIAILFIYRYDYRPSEVRKECDAISRQAANNALEEKSKVDDKYQGLASKGYYMHADYDESYRRCMRSHGME